MKQNDSTDNQRVNDVECRGNSAKEETSAYDVLIGRGITMITGPSLGKEVSLDEMLEISRKMFGNKNKSKGNDVVWDMNKDK